MRGIGSGGVEARDQSKPGLRKIGVVALTVGALISSIHPLFGEHGIVAAIVLPVQLEGVGPPLITIVSWVLAALALVEILGGELGRGVKVFGAAAFLAGLALVALYLSWLTPKGVSLPSVPHPAVVVLLVVGFAVACITVSFVTFAAVLAFGADTGGLGVQEQVAGETETEPTASAKKTGDSTANTRLWHFVLAADWERILAERPQQHGPAWKLYGAIAAMVCAPRQDARDLKRARRWVRLLTIVDLIPRSKASAVTRRALVCRARGILPVLAKRNRAWRTIEAHRDGQDGWESWEIAWKAYADRAFLLFELPPDNLGYLWLIRETDRTLSDMLAFTQTAPPLHGLAVQRLFREMKKRNPQPPRRPPDHRPELTEIMAKCRADFAAAIATSDRSAVSRCAGEAAPAYLKARQALQEGGNAWHLASTLTAQACCLALGAESHLGGAKAIEAWAYLAARAMALGHADADKLSERLEPLLADARQPQASR